jgi:hypothetical protein
MLRVLALAVVASALNITYLSEIMYMLHMSCQLYRAVSPMFVRTKRNNQFVSGLYACCVFKSFSRDARSLRGL